jgi:hypothetical protein
MAKENEEVLTGVKGYDGHLRHRTSVFLRVDIQKRIEALARFHNRSGNKMTEIMLVNQIDAEEKKAAKEGYKIPKH